MRKLVRPFLVLLALLLAASAGAAPLQQRASYAVRWAGIEVGRFTAELRRDGERYLITYRASTAGPLAWVVDLESDGWAAGWIIDGAVVPEHFRGQTNWGEGERFWRVTFAQSGEVTALELDPDTLADREPVPEPLMRGPDPLSLALEAMLQAAADRPMDAVMYDGKRAVRVEMACDGDRLPVRLAALGPATRQALLCRANGERLAGRSKRWSDEVDEETRDRPPARIWLVADLGLMPYWPVRIEMESGWGALVIELDALGQPPA